MGWAEVPVKARWRVASSAGRGTRRLGLETLEDDGPGRCLNVPSGAALTLTEGGRKTWQKALELSPAQGWLEKRQPGQRP